MGLIADVRKCWYNNEGNIIVNDYEITRMDIFTYGGPSILFKDCPICQSAEWLSRITQSNCYTPHECPTSALCEVRCSHQGDELWTHHHQDFSFMHGNDPKLKAPRGLFVLNPCLQKRFLYPPTCDTWAKCLQRQFAMTCQLDYVTDKTIISRVNWDNYDFLFIFNGDGLPQFPRPPIPIIIYGQDHWKHPLEFYQNHINHFKPDFLLTPFVSLWSQHFTFPDRTEIWLYPLFASQFFTRPNIKRKTLDLLVLGSNRHDLYRPRHLLNDQIQQISQFNIEFNSFPGYFRNSNAGPTEVYNNIMNATARYANKWSEYISLARYAIFGRCDPPASGCLLMKYYECMGSGAIPIFPEVPDLKLLNVKPFVHYIPLSEVEGNNDALIHYLGHYWKYKYIAHNASEWHKNWADRMLFQGFESLIRRITHERYPRRRI